MEAHSCKKRRIGPAVLFALLLASGASALAGPIFLPVRVLVPDGSQKSSEPTTPASLGTPPSSAPREPETNPTDQLELVRPPAPLPALNATTQAAGSSPAAQEAARWAIYRINPRGTIEIILNQPLLLELGSEPLRFLCSPQVQASKLSAREMTLTGTQLGESVLHLWFEEPGEAKKVFAVAYLIRVRADRDGLADPAQPQALQRLQAQINQTFPDNAVRLTVVGRHVVISGQAKDRFESEAIFQLVQDNTLDLSEQVRSPLMLSKPLLACIGRMMPDGVQVLNALRTGEGSHPIP